MPQRYNELTSQTRIEPQAYKASGTDANGYEPVYEAWADPSSLEASAVWCACKNTYGSTGVKTKREWADNAKFSQVATDLSTLTYA